jgi:hypothetical protein
MYIEQLQLPAEENGRCLPLAQSMGTFACYLAQIKQTKGYISIETIAPIIEHVQRAVHALTDPESSVGANNSTLLASLGHHTSTIVASEMLSAIRDEKSGYSELPYYIFNFSDGNTNHSGLLIPAPGSPQSGHSQELYLAFGDKKLLDKDGQTRSHPLAQAPLSAGLATSSVPAITSSLTNGIRATVKVDSEQLLAANNIDTAKALWQFPWLRVGRGSFLDDEDYDRVIRWHEQPKDASSMLVMNIYQPERGRAVLQAQHAFTAAVRQDRTDLVLAMHATEVGTLDATVQQAYTQCS